MQCQFQTKKFILAIVWGRYAQDCKYFCSVVELASINLFSLISTNEKYHSICYL